MSPIARWRSLVAILGLLAFCMGGASRDHEMRVLALRVLAPPLLAGAIIRLLANGRLVSEPLVRLAMRPAPPVARLQPLPPSAWQARLSLMGEAHPGYSGPWQASVRS